MLQVTQAAVKVLLDLRTEAEVPDDAAIRIQMMQTEQDSRQGIGFIFVDTAERGDEVVVEQGGLRVLVSEDLAPPLSEAVLDAQPNDSGATLVLRDQSPAQGPEEG